jgi:hypothetical protein
MRRRFIINRFNSTPYILIKPKQWRIKWVGNMVRTSERELHTKLIGKFEKKEHYLLICVLPSNLLQMYLGVVATYRSHSSTLKRDSTVLSGT